MQRTIEHRQKIAEATKRSWQNKKLRGQWIAKQKANGLRNYPKQV